MRRGKNAPSAYHTLLSNDITELGSPVGRHSIKENHQNGGMVPASHPHRLNHPQSKHAWCQSHHIIPWAVQGNTDIDDMCLLCSRCHHKVHDDRWVVRKKPTGKYHLKPPLKHDRPTTTRRNRGNYRRRRSHIKQRK